MADFGSSIPGQVVSELASIPKKMVETVVSGSGKPQETGQSANDPLVAMKAQKEAAAKKRLAEVRNELQEFYEREKQKTEHEESMVEEQKKQETTQIKKAKKRQEEQEVLQRLSSQYGGTSEVAKGGN